MRNKFELQLEKLTVELIKMGALCEHIIAIATKSIFEHDDRVGDRIKKAEQSINDKEKEIESLCVQFLLTQHPVATDLRFTTSILKMISDLERIGDQAYEISEISKMLKGTSLPNETDLRDMSEHVISMVTQSVNAFVHRDSEIAKRVIISDDISDEFLVKIHEKLVEEITINPDQARVYLDYIMITKYLERIGDHAVNVAEWVIYSVSGTHAEV